MIRQEQLREPDTAIDAFFLEDKSIEHEKRKIRKKLGMTQSKEKIEKPSVYASLKLKLYRAGLEKEATDMLTLLLHLSLIATGLGLVIFGIWGIMVQWPWMFLTGALILWIIAGILGFFPFFRILLELYLGYRVFRRKMEVERVLPEFLRLVATNYRSGLPLDKALEKSNRDRFGIFSKEIDLMAKAASAKGDLAKALEIFGKKFDSKILERSMNSLAMSVRSGSNVSSLLEEIATNITRMRNIRNSMAANVKNYVIFIIVAAILIAPLMYSMSFSMNTTISDVKGLLTETQDGASAAPGSLSAVSLDGGVDAKAFNTFAILMLITNSFICAFVISMIRHGNFQEGIRNILPYLVISIILYHAGKFLFAGLSTVV